MLKINKSTFLVLSFLLGSAYSSMSTACSIGGVDPEVVRQKLFERVKEETGYWYLEDVNIVSKPELQEPLPLGASCSGLHSWHHTATFTFKDDSEILKITCTIQGLAVMMGYAPEESPVAVKWEKDCAPMKL